MDLRHLKYFLMVAEELHFTRAAKRLFITQPPLSQQIKQMEEEVGTELFIRKTRSVSLTEAGRAFMPHAHAAIRSAEQAVLAARRASVGELGQLRIGFTSSASFNPQVPAIISSFRETYPDMDLILVEQATSLLLSDLKADKLDVAFLRPTSSQRKRMAVQELLEEPLWLALPARHPLSFRTALSLSELAGDSFIIYPRTNGSLLYDAIIVACQNAGFSPRIIQEAPQMVSTVNLVAAGVGVAMVPESMRQLHSEGVVYIRITKPTPSISLWVAHQHQQSVAPNILNFMKHVEVYHSSNSRNSDHAIP